MRTFAIAMTSLAALTLAGCGSKEQTNVTTVDTTTSSSGVNDTAATTMPVSAGQTFANTAASSDAFEIETSKLALTTSSSASIKKFAQKMIDAHTDSTAKLKTAASGASPAISPDPTLTPEQASKLASMKTLTGKAFDEAYIAAQQEGHQKTLDVLRAYSSSGDVPALKAFATSLTPTVTAHLNMAKSLKA